MRRPECHSPMKTKSKLPAPSGCCNNICKTSMAGCSLMSICIAHNPSGRSSSQVGRFVSQCSQSFTATKTSAAETWPVAQSQHSPSQTAYLCSIARTSLTQHVLVQYSFIHSLHMFASPRVRYVQSQVRPYKSSCLVQDAT